MSTPSDWLEFASFPDAVSAEAMAGLFRSEALPVRVIADEPVPGLAHGFRVLVPADLMHRARWIVAQAQVSDEELDFIATGKLKSD